MRDEEEEDGEVLEGKELLMRSTTIHSPKKKIG